MAKGSEDYRKLTGEKLAAVNYAADLEMEGRKKNEVLKQNFRDTYALPHMIDEAVKLYDDRPNKGLSL